MQSAGCVTKHDIETSYGGYMYLHKITDFLYDIDAQTFDLVAAGTAKIGGSVKPYIYYLDDHQCAVRWHYMLATTEVTRFYELKIRSESERVYGVSLSGTKWSLFEIKTADLRPSESLTINFYKLASAMFNM